MHAIAAIYLFIYLFQSQNLGLNTDNRKKSTEI